MKILENLLYQHRRGEKLTRDSENFIELRGRERIWQEDARRRLRGMCGFKKELRVRWMEMEVE